MRRTSKRKHIYLIGFSGSGKSTVGKRLAVRRECRFVDTDKEIADRFDATVSSIFAEFGEPRFRCEETAVLNRVAGLASPVVVAVGGGGFERAANRRMMRESGIVVYLKCSIRELYRRLRDIDDRPLIRAGESRLAAMKRMLAQRRPRYEEADITVSVTSGTLQTVVDRITKRLTEYERKNRS
ncbi:shikimate kinase [candidate division GN15 bacterium]|uniref:Shikimate kinase n=1 Tax=candidate division GN15 bacterium TaxID=2072418 RepID=A0A855X600_9BACT|nr:MAG: shikimate kinase [candidate division GN15 bacterium]